MRPLLQRASLLGLLALGLIALSVPAAQASQYRVLLCAAGAGQWNAGTATNTTSAQNPEGIFRFFGNCPSGTHDPAGESGYLKVWENQPSGAARVGAFGRIYWDSPTFTHFKTAGGYTRQPAAFNAGWRSRLMGVDFADNTQQFITQGVGLPNQGEQAGSSNIFGPHIWPFPDQRDFHRFLFEMTCVRPSGCDRGGLNETDINGLKFTMSDDQDSQVAFTNQGASPLLSGQWVRGGSSVTWHSADNGSGLRFERVFIDNSNVNTIDYQAAGSCDAGFSTNSGEFARQFRPCPTGGPFERSWYLDTASLSDGPHALAVCTQDFGQFQGLNGTGGQTCTAATVRTDNTAPGAPSGLEVMSSNPARYLSHFGAHWSLPPNEGSPISSIHYEIVDAEGKVVVPEKMAIGTNLTKLADIEGPAAPGEYRLKLWLEDEVGFTGPASTAPIPHDTTPPAAPQEIAVTAPSTTRTSDGFDLRWRNLTDLGSPIAAVHYQVLDANGSVAVPTRTLAGEGVHQIAELLAPEGAGGFTLRLWLSDAEGNVGAPASAALAYSCPRSKGERGTAISAGLGGAASERQVVQQGTGSLISGNLKGTNGGGVGGATVCVFGRVVTDRDRVYLGTATTGRAGIYRFPIPAGPSREMIAAYRGDHREVENSAEIATVAHPTFAIDKKVVVKNHWVRFTGRIPGPHADGVVVLIQMGEGHGWRTFHRYRTRHGGRFDVGYHFKHRFERVLKATKLKLRAQIRETVGYPYLQGNSKALKLTVVSRRRG